MKYETTSHVAVQVNDYDKALNFYENVLGFQLKKTHRDETEFETGVLTLYVENNAKQQVFFDLRVKDVVKAKQELVNAGCQITQEYSEKSVLVKDPYGMNFHLFSDE